MNRKQVYENIREMFKNTQCTVIMPGVSSGMEDKDNIDHNTRNKIIQANLQFNRDTQNMTATEILEYKTARILDM